MQLVIGLCFHSSAMKDVVHDELSLALLIEFRQPGAGKRFCCISEQQCSTNFLVSMDFKRSDCLRHLSSTLTEQSNSEDAFLSRSIVHARMSALSLPTESVSPGA